MVSKEKQAKIVAEAVYRKHLVKLGMDLSDEQKEAMHAEAVPEAQRIKPDINPSSIKHLFGYVKSTMNAEAKNAEAKRLAEEEEKSRKAEQLKVEDEDDTQPAKEVKPVKPASTEAGKLDELEKRMAGMEDTVNSVAGAVQGLTEFLSKQTVRGNGRSEQTRQIEARFPTFEVKFSLDTFRMSLFQAWKADHRFEGEIEDFLKDAFDEALRQRGATLEYTARKGNVIPR